MEFRVWGLGGVRMQDLEDAGKAVAWYRWSGLLLQMGFGTPNPKRLTLKPKPLNPKPLNPLTPKP